MNAHHIYIYKAARDDEFGFAVAESLTDGSARQRALFAGNDDAHHFGRDLAKRLGVALSILPSAQKEPTVQQVMVKLKAHLQRRPFVTLARASYDDILHSAQVARLLRGENPYESGEFAFIEEAESDTKYQAAIEILKVILDDDEYQALEDHNQADEARFLVEEYDDSDMIEEMFKRTGSLLMRYDLGIDVDTDHSSSEQDRDDMITAIVEHLGLRPGHQTRDTLNELLIEAIYGGRLWAIWYADARELAEQAIPSQKARHRHAATPATITFGVGCHLLVLDQVNGSGHAVKVNQAIAVPFDSECLTTDKDGNGHGWDSIANVVSSAYAADVSIDVLMWESAETDEPGHRQADSVLRSGCYQIGPDTGVPIAPSVHRLPRLVDGWFCIWIYPTNKDGTEGGEVTLGRTFISERVAKQAAEKNDRFKD